jgi:polyvinyl alcohol dehydrogenase (cytochrome)
MTDGAILLRTISCGARSGAALQAQVFWHRRTGLLLTNTRMCYATYHDAFRSRGLPSYIAIFYCIRSSRDHTGLCYITLLDCYRHSSRGASHLQAAATILYAGLVKSVLYLLEMRFPMTTLTLRLLTLLAFVAGLVLACEQCTAQTLDRRAPKMTAADWSSYNNGHLGWRFNAAEKTLSPATAPKLLEKWRFPPAGSKLDVGVIHGTPAVVNGYVYFATATYPAIYKLKPNGQIAWVYRPQTGKAAAALPKGGTNRIDAGNGFLSSPLVTETSVFIGGGPGIFYALDRFTGKELWKVNTRAIGFPEHHWSNIFNASAIYADGKVIVGGGGYEHAHALDPNYPCCSGRGFVVAFDPGTGKVVWKYEVGEKPQRFEKPVVLYDDKGKHVYQYGPSTSSVWSTPSYDAESGSVFFGTDSHNSPRKPTADNPKIYTKFSSAVIAIDIKTGKEKWVSQINKGDVFNHTMSGYDSKTGRYKDCTIGDTPKIYSINSNGQTKKALGVGCKNGGFYLLDAISGKQIANTPIYQGKPQWPLKPKPSPRMIALPSTIGGIQTGCATDGKNVFTNGIDWLSSNTIKPGWPEAGRVVSISNDLTNEHWRHERPRIRVKGYHGGDPVASGIALGGGVACFTTTISEQLVVLNAATGKPLKQFWVGTVWSGPSISRGRVYVGSGSILFLKKQLKGTLYSFGLPGKDEIDAMGTGDE